MGNQIQIGLRINVDGSRQGAAAIDQVTESTSRLGTTTAQVGTAMQSAQAGQAAAAGHLRDSQAAVGAAISSVNAQLGAATSSHLALGNAAQQASQPIQNLGMSARATAAAMRNVPAQFTDIVTSLQGGQSPLTVFLQQGGQLRDMFGSWGGAARALATYVKGLIGPYTAAAAAVAVLGLAYYQGSAEVDAYNRTLIMSGQVAGRTAGQLSDMARSIKTSVGTQGEAAAALAELAGVAQIAPENLQKFATVAIGANKDLGASTAELAKNYADLGKDPVKASIALTSQLHYLSGATYDTIKSLAEQGRAEEAASLAQNAYADALAERSAKMKASLGIMERAWEGVKGVAKGAWDAILDIGREDSLDQKLQKAEARLAAAQRARLSFIGGGQDGKQELDAAQKKVDALREQRDAEAWSAQAKREGIKLDEAHVKWVEMGTQYLDKETKLRLELDRQRQAGLDAGESDDVINKRLAQVRKQYGDLNNVALAGLEAKRNLEREQLNGSMADLDSAHKRELVLDAAYVAQKRDLQVADIDAEIGLTKRQAELASGKADLAERARYLGALAVLQEQRKNILRGAQNALDEYSFAATKAIKDQGIAWENAGKAERAALAGEVAMFGQSAEARAIATEQLKVEAEQRQLIANWQKQGHTFSEGEIADLKRQADARKADIASIMGQRQALAGAEQLRQENRKFAADSIADEDTRAARLLQIDADTWRERIRLAGDGTEAQRRLQEQFDTWYANRQLAPVVDRWKGIISNLDNDFRDGFRGMLEHGNDAWKSFASAMGNTLKTSLADALYQTFIKKYVVQIVTNLAGMISGQSVQAALTGGTAANAAGGAGGATGLLGIAQTASNLYKAMTGGLNGLTSTIGTGLANLGTTLGSSSLQGFGMGLQGTAGMSSEGAAYLAQNVSGFSAGAAAAPWVGAAAGYGIGSTLNSAISGQYQTGSGVQTVEKIATAVASYLGGPLGGAIAGAVSGLVNRAFGHGPKEIQSQGIRGDISASGVAGEGYAKWHQDGGWFRSDRDGTDTSTLKADVANTLQSGFASVLAASKGFADSLGVDAAALQDYHSKFNITLTGDSAANQAAITKFFTTLGDEVAQKLVPSISDFAKVGETASATLQRLAGDFQVTTTVATMLGKDAASYFGGVGVASAGARERLIDLAGGADKLSAQASGFAQNYLSDAERLAPVAKALNDALGSLSLTSIPQTRDQFKALVQGLDPLDAAQAKTLTSLLGLQDVFAQVHPATEKATKAIMSADEEQAAILQARAAMYEAMGDKAGQAAVLEKQHAAALAEMPAALAAATQAQWDAQQAAQVKAAAEQEQAAILQARAAMYEAMGDKAGQAAVLEEQHATALALMTPALAAATKAQWEAQQAAQVKAAAEQEQAAILQARAAMYEAMGDKAGQASVLEAQHTAALAQMTPALAAATHAQWDAQKAAQAKAAAEQEQAAILQARATMYEAMGDKAGAAAVIEMQRVAALEAMTPALAAATAAEWAATDAAKAKQDALNEQNQILALQERMYTANGDTASAALIVEKQHQLALQGMSKALADASKATWAAEAAAAAVKNAQEKAQQSEKLRADAIEKARGALAQAYDRESSALKQTMEQAQEAAKKFLEFKKSLLLDNLSTLSPAAQYEEARRQFENATPDQLPEAARAFLEASRAYNASNEQYVKDFALVQSSLEHAANAASEQAATAQGQLDLLAQQVAGIGEVNQSVMSVAQALAAYHAAVSAPPPVIQDAAPIDPAIKPPTSAPAGTVPQPGYLAGTTAGWTSTDWAYIRNQVKNGSHAGGLERVPYDGYMAEVHYGEAVVDAQSVSAIRRYFGTAPVRANGSVSDAGDSKLAAAIERQNELLERLITTVEDSTDANAGSIRSLKQHLSKVLSKPVAA